MDVKSKDIYQEEKKSYTEIFFLKTFYKTKAFFVLDNKNSKISKKMSKIERYGIYSNILCMYVYPVAK